MINFGVVEGAIAVSGPVGSSRLTHGVLLLARMQAPELFLPHLQDSSVLAVIHVIEAPSDVQ